MTDHNNPPAPVAGDTGADTGPVATVFTAWKSFSVEEPPEDAALDDPSVTTTRKVLVTNNLNARNRMGLMSHLWLARPIKVRDGEWAAYTDDDLIIHGVTHWLDPFGASQDDHGHCHECGKKSSDGWALYCVVCMEKIGMISSNTAGQATCTCPSGDGSLRWPCRQHPPSQPAAVPDGWKLVPVVPTEEMEWAGQEAIESAKCRTSEAPAVSYLAMLSAAPVPPSQEAKDAERYELAGYEWVHPEKGMQLTREEPPEYEEAYEIRPVFVRIDAAMSASKEATQ